MSSKKPGGLEFNPLLARTEPEATEVEKRVPEPTSTHVSNQTSVRVDTSASASKFTFYFTPQQLDRLDRAWEVARRQVRGTGQRISKSQFVRLALDRLLDDFEVNSGEVIQQLLKHQ